MLTTDAHEVDAADEVAALYVTLKPLLHAIATRRFGIPHDEAEALVHDLFAAYLHRRPDILAVRTWFIAAICNASRHYWRGHTRFVTLTEAEVHEPTEPPAYIARITAQTILARLAIRDRQVLWLRFWEGHAVRAVGLALSVSESRAEKLLHRALKRAAHAADATTLGADDDAHRRTGCPRLRCKTLMRATSRRRSVQLRWMRPASFRPSSRSSRTAGCCCTQRHTAVHVLKGTARHGQRLPQAA